MEMQAFFNIAVGLVAFFGGWVLNSITRSLDRLDGEIREMHREYVTKNDYHRDIDELKSICKQIFDKLDAKADK